MTVTWSQLASTCLLLFQAPQQNPVISCRPPTGFLELSESRWSRGGAASAAVGPSLEVLTHQQTRFFDTHTVATPIFSLFPETDIGACEQRNVLYGSARTCKVSMTARMQQICTMVGNDKMSELLGDHKTSLARSPLPAIPEITWTRLW